MGNALDIWLWWHDKSSPNFLRHDVWCWWFCISGANHREIWVRLRKRIKFSLESVKFQQEINDDVQTWFERITLILHLDPTHPHPHTPHPQPPPTPNPQKRKKSQYILHGDHLHALYAPTEIVQIGWGHRDNFCVCFPRLTHVTGMEHRLFHSVTHGVPLENLSDRTVLLGLRFDGGGGAGVGWG